MEYAVNVLWALGGLGALLYGMRILSDTLQKSAGGGLSKLFDKMSGNRLVGVGVGAGVTAVIQSSAATTVMVLGFVNAGLMTLYQATTVIMGANIGTTVTGLIMGLSAFEIAPFFGGAGAVGALMSMMSKNEKVCAVGNFIAGLGLIFVGLELMSRGLGFFSEIPAVRNFFLSVNAPILLLFIGMIFTAVIQSSSAMTGIVITFVGSGIMPLSTSLFIVLGANIGTCVTAILAALGGTANTKRAAIIHLMFNVLGAVICYPILRFLADPISGFFLTVAGGEPKMALAFFHLAFNVLTSVVMIPFVRQFVFIVEKIVPKKSDGDGDRSMVYIDERILSTPSVAVGQIRKEISVMAELARENLDIAVKGLFGQDVKVGRTVDKNEQKIDFLTKGISSYLVQISGHALTEHDEREVGTMHHVIADLERIGDHAKNIADYTQQLADKKLALTESATEELKEMYAAIEKMFPIAIKAYISQITSGLREVTELENSVDDMKEVFASHHIARLNKGDCTVDTGAVFFNVLVDLERIADHLNNVAFSVLPHRKSIRKERIKEYAE